ncbi:hypothetical protein D092_20855 [Rhodococcus ruber Chol-4]|nr:hypothetical protein D092_20855 [Rhodococcus ruber Chol-4]
MAGHARRPGSLQRYREHPQLLRLEGSEHPNRPRAETDEPQQKLAEKHPEPGTDPLPIAPS